MSYRILEFHPNLLSARLHCSFYQEGSHCENLNNKSGMCYDDSCPLKHRDWWKRELLEWINIEMPFLEIITQSPNITESLNELKQKIEEM